MSEKNNNLKVLNSLPMLLKHKETALKTELLELFASYIYLTNPDYKYNETYLKDMIPMFWNNIEKYISKVSFRDNLINMLEKIVIKDACKCQLKIQIDELWEIEFDSLSEKCERKWENKISEIPKLNAVDRENIYVKYHYKDGQNMVLNDYLESNDRSKLLNFTKSSIDSYLERLGGEVNNGKINTR